MAPTELPSGAPGLSTPARWLLRGLAVCFVLLGVIGLFLPVMPTVPFLIVAAWAAARSSPRLHAWLMNHPHFGRQLREWNEHGIVPRRAKWITSAMMAGSAVTLLALAPRPWLAYVLVVIAVMAAVLWWLWRRPEHKLATSTRG